jgi:seryl-tRNA synthetase
MFSRIKKDFDEGIEKIKWFSSLLSERVRIEITVFKLLYTSEELKKRRDELMRKIGEEVYAMRGKEKNIYANKEVIDAIKELETLEPEIKETIERASEISKIVA